VFEIREGVRWIYRGSGLTTLAIATHGWFVGNAVIGVVLAPYALVMLNLTPSQFGLIGALGGIGAVVGAAVTTRVGLLLGTSRTIIACHAITTASVLVMVTAGGISTTWASAALLGTEVGLYGLAMGMSNSREMSFRQLLTPDELQARTTRRSGLSTVPSWSSSHRSRASWRTTGGSDPPFSPPQPCSPPYRAGSPCRLSVRCGRQTDAHPLIGMCASSTRWTSDAS
jgi:hypothetical protein